MFWPVGNPYRKHWSQDVGVWNPYRKPRSQVGEGCMLEGWNIGRFAMLVGIVDYVD